ncbi:molybdate ABC transporter permease subunit [Motiliproteus sediminis]|uniref:molybdate ABC transporter permease subunit n=1 Tax=Motiliproteus sediminis TaxID=1468178 RepID=UPI001FEC7748|nr:molybdate ABC transporter permease subunit [Motiliproteus sediminis]
MDWTTVWITIRLAAVTTLVLLLVGTPLAWWLARSRRWWKELVGTVVALPLVLPPTVLGFYLLVLMSPEGWIGIMTQWAGAGTLAFTFSGLVLGSVLYSLPFMVQPLRGAFEQLGDRPLEVAATLGASPADTFFSVVVPLCRSGFLSGAVLSFAHTVGEFGVVLMIGGNIPGETKVLSVAIYDHVEALDWAQAHWMAGGMVAFAFVVLAAMYLLEGRSRREAL